MKRQFASGGIVVKKKDGSLSVLLIKDSYGHWTWPKGHIEEGENPEGAALREVTEESGLKDIKIIEEVGRQEYYFTLHGEKIFKTVHVFLMEASSDEDLVPQTSEIQEAVWYPPGEALNTIEYQGSREILEKAIKMFKEKGKD